MGQRIRAQEKALLRLLMFEHQADSYLTGVSTIFRNSIGP